MKHLLTLALLLTVINLQAADGEKKLQLSTNGLSERSTTPIPTFSDKDHDDLEAKIKALIERHEKTPRSATTSNSTPDQFLAVVQKAATQGCRDVFSAPTAEAQVAALVAKLTEASKTPSIANVLEDAQITAAIAANLASQLAAHFNTVTLTPDEAEAAVALQAKTRRAK